VNSEKRPIHDLDDLAHEERNLLLRLVVGGRLLDARRRLTSPAGAAAASTLPHKLDDALEP